jgi:magnesium-transporting ATPase (P-type)
MTTTNQIKLTDKINQKLKNQKPIPRLYFNILFCLSIFIVVLLVSLAVFSLTFFAWDFMRLLSDKRPNPGMFIRLIFLSLGEFLVLGVLAGYGIIRLLRTFDKSIFKNIWLLVAITISGILGLVIAFVTVISHNPILERHFDKFDDRTNELPHRRNRKLPPRRNRPIPKNNNINRDNLRPELRVM